jgi:two-component system nitrogen regulation response regulator GlnG
MTPSLLVVDDEPAIQHAFSRAFRGSESKLSLAATAAEAVRLFKTDHPDVVVLDVHLPDATGLETYLRLREIDARVPVILVTGHGTTDLAIKAISEGAFEYLLKPLELAELRAVVDRAVRASRLMREPASLPEVEPAPTGGDPLVGRCSAMQEVYKAIGRVARQDVTVLIRGESGTGKELVARAIYQHSKRADRPFMAINCAAIPETLLESELFGHEKGAFTGADRKHIGRFEQCHGGTIFLDEIGEMTPLTQAKVLRLIQEQAFERVGGTTTVQTDVRIISATNADLEKLAEDGRFRKDLYFRLNVFTIRLPPLRERGDDVPLLIDHYLRRLSVELGKPETQMSPEALALLRAHNWPGNVRELQSVLKQTLIQANGSVVLADFLPDTLRHAAPTSSSSATVSSAKPATTGAPTDWDEFVNARLEAGTETLYGDALELMEREVLLRVLRHTGGNQVHTARILGITRGSLRNKMRNLNIEMSRQIWSEDDQPES